MPPVEPELPAASTQSNGGREFRFYRWHVETISPTNDGFFFHLRTDAEASKTNEEKDDVLVLEKGLPAKR
ncbi:hypothetical protein H6A60_11485 [Sutterella massiliensis]|uniref:Uncharacterized protein n=1 Tax=Sutterella massiliensis TaxID=1816689 RepID=A0ABS2DVB4_9BURK|nr:hypothetical protein [Sutterella massiliensis]